MELKLARTELNSKPKNISIEKLVDSFKQDAGAIFYFDKTNAHKDLMEAIKRFEKEGFNTYFREIRYGLDQDDYLYQIHVL